MACSRRSNALAIATLHKNLLLAAFAAFLALFPLSLRAADAGPADKLSDGDMQCLGCHGSDGLKKDLSGGKLLSLHVQRDGFAKSVHGVVGCASRPADVDLNTHLQKPKTITSSRDYSIPDNCREGMNGEDMNGKFPKKSTATRVKFRAGELRAHVPLLQRPDLIKIKPCSTVAAYPTR